MYAIQAVRPGGPDVLEWCEVPDPVPGSGQLLVRPTAVGLNFIDTYLRSGVYPAEYPHIPGSEGAGTVIGVGPDTATSLGARVAWADSVTGSYAEQVLVNEDRAIPVPEGLELERAAALPLQGMTAHYLVRSTFPVSAEHTVLLYGAAGGVGLLAGQMIRRTGARLLAAVSSAAKAKVLHAAGQEPGDILILNDMDDVTVDVPREVRRRTDGEGVHVVYDGIGRTTFEASLASLRRRGMLVLFGGASGQVPPFDPQRLNSGGSLYLTRPKLNDYTADAEELAWRGGEIMRGAAAGELHVRIGSRFSLEEAADAHRAIESGKTTGKVLLVSSVDGVEGAR